MKYLKKYTCILFLSLGISLIITDCGLFTSTFSHSHFHSHRLCTGLANHSEDSHASSYADHDVFNESFNHYNFFDGDATDLRSQNDLFKNIFCPLIWQPPKQS